MSLPSEPPDGRPATVALDQRVHLVAVGALTNAQETAIVQLAENASLTELRVIAAGDLPAGDLRFVAYLGAGSSMSGTLHVDGSITS